ncbi:hypothetical protein [Vogesella indigofera]|uniref:hypothetical protein n=1 Tax=Vogesella indigofera TaxID=45465 RepID=UPI0035B2BD77
MSHGGALQPLLAGEQQAAYVLYRNAMMAGLRRIARWDEALQRQRFAASHQAASLFWFEDSGARRALLSLRRDDAGLIVDLLVVPPAQQRRGSGRRAMRLVHALCRPGEQVRLSCLRRDRRVRAFYAALGYRVEHAGADFLELVWQAPA